MAGDEEYVKYAVFHDRYSEYAVGVAVVLVDNFRCKTVRGPVQFTLRGSTADAEIMVPPLPPTPNSRISSSFFLLVHHSRFTLVCYSFYLLITQAHLSLSFLVIKFLVLSCFCLSITPGPLSSVFYFCLSITQCPFHLFLFLLIDHSMPLSSVLPCNKVLSSE